MNDQEVQQAIFKLKTAIMNLTIHLGDAHKIISIQTFEISELRADLEEMRTLMNERLSGEFKEF